MALTVSQIKEFLTTSESSTHIHKETVFTDLFDLNLHEEKNIDKIVQTINNFLNISTNRQIGFTFLGLMIPHCPTSILNEHCVQWIKICTPTQINKTISMEQLTVIEVLLENCCDIQDFVKTLSTGLLSKLIELFLTNLGEKKCLEKSLKCLQLCLRKFSNTCLPMKNKISGALLKFLDSKLSDRIVQSSGASYHFLQQVGGAGPDSINHINNWSTQFQKLCTTVHILYDGLFENVTEYGTYTQNGESFSFDEIPSAASYLEFISITSIRLKNTLLFINSFLVESYPVAKHIPVPEILDVIKRGLSADCFKKTENLEDLHLSSLLYDVQIELLLLLRSLLACLKQNILPQSFLITKLLTDCLLRAQSYEYFINKKEFQVTVYKVLSYWLTISRSTINLSINDKLIEAFLHDILPMKSNITLSISTEFAKKSTKLKQKKIEEQLVNLSHSNVRVHSKNFIGAREQISLHAIKFLKDLCLNTVLNIKPQTTTKLYKTVIQTLLEIQGGKITNPYNVIRCQAALYELTLSFFEQKYTAVLPPLHIALQIFRRGQSVKNDSISRTCSRAIQILETFCQPVCPTLYLGDIDSSISDKNEETTTNFLEEELESEDLEESVIADKDMEEEKTSSEKVKILSVEIVKNADVEPSKPETEVEEIRNEKKNVEIVENDTEDAVVVLDISDAGEDNLHSVKSVSTEYDSDNSLEIQISSDEDVREVPPPAKKRKTEIESPTTSVIGSKFEESVEVKDNVQEDMLDSFVDDVVDEA